MKIICTVVLALFGFASLASGQQTCSGDWPEFHNTNMRRENTCESVLNVNNVGNLVLKWRYSGSGGIVTSPVIANGTLFAVATLRSYALDAITGTKLWGKEGLGYVHPESPAVGYGMVYDGSQSGLYAVNAQTGRVIWTFPMGGGAASSPTVSNGVVYVGSGGYDGTLYALDARNGTRLWTYPALVDGSPAVFHGVVYVGAYDNVYALDANSGAVLWTFPVVGLVASSPAIADGVVYVGTGGPPSVLYALDAATGSPLWSRSTSTGTGFTSPALAYGMVFVGLDNTSNTDDVFALDARTGAVRWSYNTGGAFGGVASPAVANGVVYFAAENYSIYAFNATNGTKLWSYQTGNYLISGPVVSNGMLYVGGWDSYVYAFGLP